MRAVRLDDRFELETGSVLINGAQALTRLALDQRRRDLAAGLNTAGYISGYRGSPLGNYDFALSRAAKHLREHHVVFNPAVNEELAATAIYGTQQLRLFPGARYDGVFSIWYGKGPGVDRAGDALKHGNLAGTSEHGGVLVLAGDDHGAKSSTTAHQSELALSAAHIPVLYPATVEEYLELAPYAFALSRFSGLWIGFKCVNDTVETTETARLPGTAAGIVLPEGVELPPGGLGIRKGEMPLEQEKRTLRYRLPAALAFARANRLDRVALDAGTRGLGIVSTGKAYLDVRQALYRLGIDDHRAQRLGIRVYKVGLSWPLEPLGLREFARGHRELLVVEEKRPLLETQVKDALYHVGAAERPAVVGKQDERGAPLLPSEGELDPVTVAAAILKRLAAIGTLDDALRTLASAQVDGVAAALAPVTSLVRSPYFCSGCPHNTSTRVPEGSLSLAGIGCHVMAAWMPDRAAAWPMQMGGEGANWVGLAPFTDTRHVFQNLGDGTYFHSGTLAVRAAVASGVNVTYKVLYNDAVAMTGGQQVDGQLTVAQLAGQLIAEGVRKVVVVADDPGKYPAGTRFPEGVALQPREALDRVQRELREIPGTTALIYDQVCAAEKRRRRKRNEFPDPPKRVFINDLVCEGCGDCGRKSNCVSVQPLETELGRKRVIDQSSCNKDYSCVNGFCPSFVTVHGGTLAGRERQAKGAALQIPPLPAEPSLELESGRIYSVLITGIGGTGVVTVGSILAMAAHLDAKGATAMDMTGLSQKNGAVLSHVRISSDRARLFSQRIAQGEADLLLACDLVVAAGKESVATVRRGQTRAVLNTRTVATPAFIHQPNLDLGGALAAKQLQALAGPSFQIDATEIATRLLGDSIGANMFMLGYAAQAGMLPVKGESLRQAIRLNGAAMEMNLQAFELGRWAAVDAQAVLALVRSTYGEALEKSASASLEEALARRAEFLTGYQNAAYAAEYRAFVDRIRPHGDELAWAVARSLFKLMAYKDEYEVARLYTEGSFERKLKAQFAGDYSLRFHLAPPLLARPDPATGHPRKMEFGPWMMHCFRVLAKLKFLRGTALDFFGRTAERRMERRLIADYRGWIEAILDNPGKNYPLALEIAKLPEGIRGFGHVKEESLAAVLKRKDELLKEWRAPAAAAGPATLKVA